MAMVHIWTYSGEAALCSYELQMAQILHRDSPTGNQPHVCIHVGVLRNEAVLTAATWK